MPPVFSCPRVVWAESLSLTFFFPLLYFAVATQHDPKLAPGLGKGQTYHHNIPHVGHMRLTAVPVLSHIGRTRPSILYAELDRINSKVRPSLAYQPSEDFLNSRSIVNFDDEARSIRAQTAALLKRIHTPLPRARSALPSIQPRYIETPIPERITSDVYIERMLSPMRDVRRDINSRSYYSDAAAKSNIGKGHLACVSYAGGKAFSRRKNLFYPDVDQIKNEVKFLAQYEKTREAALTPQVDSEGEVYYAPLYSRPKRDPSKPLNSRFYKGAITAPIEPSQRISAKAVASVPEPPARTTPSSRSMSTPVVETPPSMPKVERQTSLKEEPASEELDDMASRLSRKKKKKQEEREAEELEQLAMAKRVEQEALEAANEEKKKAEELKKAEEAKKEAERKAEEERLAEEARKEAERKAEEERKEAERKAEEEKKEAERKAEEERKEAERRAEEERRKAEEERLAAEKKAEEERLEAERKAEEERQAEAARQAEAEKQAAAEKEAEQKRQEYEEELARQEAEVAQLEAEAEEVDAAVKEEVAPSESEPASEPAPAADLAAETEPVPDTESEPVVSSPQTDEPEPTVQEFTSPDTAPANEDSGPAIEEILPEDE
ncbi:uncharacterized protein CG45076 isoform X3 [Anabrus simplex]|uniref:uncharacterized protein CG45076 isoform X3 n=1 Tax=Anabrus simplex TaxID=316456 RepID=UPI0035A33DCA